ncbi:uncharacterized protein AMSG_11491, partial [Thecamonas trahens ATCC 50062]
PHLHHRSSTMTRTENLATLRIVVVIVLGTMCNVVFGNDFASPRPCGSSNPSWQTDLGASPPDNMAIVVPLDGSAFDQEPWLNNPLPPPCDKQGYNKGPYHWIRLHGDGQTYSFNTCSAVTDVDTVLMAFESENAAMSGGCLRCKARQIGTAGECTFGAMETITFTAKPGNSYYVLVAIRGFQPPMPSMRSVEVTLSVTPPPPAGWLCAPTEYNDGITCDCGCGIVDPDCASTFETDEYNDHCHERSNSAASCCNIGVGDEVLHTCNTNCHDPQECSMDPDPDGHTYVPPPHDYATTTCSGPPTVLANPDGSLALPSTGYDCYVKNMNCKHVIDVPGASSIVLAFDYVWLEPQYDSVTIYEGAYVDSTKKLFTYDVANAGLPPYTSTSTPYGPDFNSVPQFVEIPGSKAMITFVSDDSHQNAGFSLQYCAHGVSSSPLCVTTSCTPGSCNGHGACANGVCNCYAGYSGPNCNSQTCGSRTSCSSCNEDSSCHWCGSGIAGDGKSVCLDSSDFSCSDPAITTCSCSMIEDCSSCTANVDCGWCFDQGLGECVDGSRLKPKDTSCIDYLYQQDSATNAVCPAPCTDECSNQGLCECSSASCACLCYFSFAGDTCAVGVSNTWQVIEADLLPQCTDDELVADMVPLAGHTGATMILDDAAYTVIYGGVTRDCTNPGLVRTTNFTYINRQSQGDGQDATSSPWAAFAVVGEFPASRAYHAATLVPQPSAQAPYAMYMMGGKSSPEMDKGVGTIHDDLWKFVLPGRWQLVCPGSACLSLAMPSPRFGHALLYSAASGADVLYVYGGLDALDVPQTGLYAFDLTTQTWSTPSTDGEPSEGRAFAAAAATTDRLLFVGGLVTADPSDPPPPAGPWSSTTLAVTNAVWSFNPSSLAWEQLTLTGSGSAGSAFPAIARATAIYDDVAKLVYVTGGMDASGNALGDLLVIDVAAATFAVVAYNTHATGKVPSPRFDAASVLVSSAGDVIVTGGFDHAAVANDVMRFHVPAYISRASPEALDPRGSASPVVLHGSFGRLVQLVASLTASTAGGGGSSATFDPTAYDFSRDDVPPELLRCAFASSGKFVGYSPTDPGEVPDGYIETNVLRLTASEVHCAVPSHPSGAVDITLTVLSNVVIPGDPPETYRFFLGTSATVTYEPCPRGTAQAKPAWSWSPGMGTDSSSTLLQACPPCAIGLFSDTLDADECRTCTPGTIAPVTGAASCTPCEPGTMSSNPRDGACTPCPAGWYAAKAGLSECSTCPVAKYAPEAGLATCLSCPTNSSMPPLDDGPRVSIDNCTCDNGFYGDPVDGGCVACSKAMVCVWGENRYPKAAPGYWRASGDSAIMFECVPAEACKADLTCSTGYIGRMCSECAPGYYKLNQYCQKCPSTDSSWKLVTAGVIGIVAVLGLVHLAKPSSTGAQKGARGGSKAAGSSSSSSSAIAAPSIAISFFQMTAVFASFGIPWPKAVVDMFSVVSLVNINVELLSPECSMEVSFYDKWQAMMLLPVVVLIFYLFALGVVLAWVSYRHSEASRAAAAAAASAATDGDDVPSEWSQMNGGEKRRFVCQLFLAGFLLFLTLAYIVLVDVTLQFFDCTKQGDGTSSLDADPSLYCYDDEWFKHLPLGVAGVVVYVVGVPGALFVLLYVLRVKLGDDLPSAAATNFFVKRFQTKYFYWEVTIMLRKLAIVVAAKFFTAHFILQSILAVLIIFASVLVTAGTRPFQRRKYNMLEIVLLISSFMVIFAGILFANDEVSGSTRQGITVAVITVMIISSVVIAIVIATEVKAKITSLCATSVAPKAATDDRGEELEVLTSLLPHDGPLLASKIGATLEPEEQSTLVALLEAVYRTDEEPPADKRLGVDAGRTSVASVRARSHKRAQSGTKRLMSLPSHVDLDVDVYSAETLEDSLPAIDPSDYDALEQGQLFDENQQAWSDNE